MINYSQEKRKFLAERSAEELREFALEIPPQKLQDIIGKLTVLKGFRPGKGVPIRLRAFFSRISHWTEREWSIMAQLWLLWTANHSSIWDALGVENPEHFKILVREMLGNGTTRDELMSRVVKSSWDKGLSEAVLRRWHDFGPFVPSEDMDRLLLMAPSENQVKLIHRVISIEKKAIVLDSQVQKQNTVLETMNRNLEHLREPSATVSELHEKIQLLDDISQTSSNNLRAVHATIENLCSQVAAQKSDYETMLDIVSTSDTLRLDGELESLRSNLSVWKGQSEEILDDLKNRLLELENNDAQNERIVPVNSSTPNRVGMLADLKLPLKTVRTEWDGDLEIIDNLKLMTEHMSKNLSRMGLKTKDAKKITVETLAALASGQMVTFEGTLATVIAEYSALSLAGESVYKMRIPIGLSDGDQIEQEVAGMLQVLESRKFPVAVIFEGINRSAFEVFGSTIRELVVNRLLKANVNRDFSLLIFSTLSDGDTNLPYGREIWGLGPIFCVDSLGWKESPASEAIPGMLLNDSWKRFIESPSNQFDWEELGIPDWVSNKGGVIWRKSLTAAVKAYSKIIEEHNLVRISSDLSFGWVFPFALTSDPGKVNELANEFEMDDRINTLLKIRLGELE
ncbi:hypothetical protein [Alicyclobacillus mengziensis]|uniref:Uncharacterized protein n=1 Tax=Alicyclobacillus mengziensis TaxID=2931921 RepID=A0A9X7VY76_9BACL|nr:MULTISPECIES: hypothetical protein [Alicyclobacillus]MCF8568210.1 hypothetical protein [Alicyclobacillus tolerans]QSO46677.1 hypothetical protein JZ786_19885 [Alicyclobacillus mengziensis]